MKTIIYKVLVLCIPFLLLAGCSHDGQPAALDDMDDDAGGSGDVPVDIILSKSAFTTGDYGETATQFTPGCLIGITVEGGGTEYTNVKFKYPDSGSTLMAVEKGIYWDGGVSSIKVNAYYPFREDGDYTKAYVMEDQNGGADGANYYNSDALTATGSVSSRGTSMTLSDFTHRMTKVIFTFNEEVSDVKILNQPLNTGDATGTASIKAYKDPDDAKVWRAFIVPGQTKLEVAGQKGEGKTFKVRFKMKSPMMAGNQYSYAATDFVDVNGSIKKDLSKESVTISDNGSYYIMQSDAGTTQNNITVSGESPTIYIHDLNISAGTAIHITGGTPTFILVGYNTLKSTENGKAGIRLNGENANVVIRGNGTLDSKGGNPAMYAGAGPGIGTSSQKETGGTITIEGGTIICTGGHPHAAAIGTSGDAGTYSKCGAISIKNATLILSKEGSCAAIGTGNAGIYGTITSNLSCGTITIENSTITIEDTSGFNQSYIGKGGTAGGSANTCGQVSIKNSVINGTTVNETYTPQ